MRSLKTGAKIGIYLTVGIGIIIIIVLLNMSTVKIKPGYAGVIYDMSGGIESKTLSQGWHFISPTKKVTSYPISTETIFLSKNSKEGITADESFDINTKSGKSVNVDVSYSYRMDVTKLPDIFTKFRGQNATIIEDNFIRRSLKSNINNVSSLYEAMEVYGSARAELKGKTFEAFSKDMAQSGIIIESFDFLAIRPDNSSMKAIQDKVDAEQKLQQAKIDQQKATVEAQTAKITAQGQADSKLISAEGEAKANTALLQNMTPQLIEYKKLEVAGKQADAQAKWPVSTFVNGGTTPFLNIPAGK
ncbi:MAG: prohibitin family protein [Clostridiaceae bacterium]|nr:prohibitin family protein [Clostridiaceae bacterium]